MKRIFYRALLLLHPAGFREQFAGEMLWIFDETTPGGGTLPLFADALLSLGRQWVIRQGTWKVAVATVGGFLYIGSVMSALTPVAVRASNAAVAIDEAMGGTDDDDAESMLRDSAAYDAAARSGGTRGQMDRGDRFRH